MGHKTLIGGTAYDIKGGKTLINGTAYDIKKGVTLIGGTGYDISFGPDKFEVYAVPNTALSNGLNFSSRYGSISFSTTGLKVLADEYDGEIDTYGLFAIPVDFTPYSTLHFTIASWRSNNCVGYNSTDTYSGNTMIVFNKFVAGSSGSSEITFDISAVSGKQYIKAWSANTYLFTISGIYLD